MGLFFFQLKNADRTHIPLIAPLFRNNTHFLYYTGTIVANRTIAPLTEHCNAPKRTTTAAAPISNSLFRNSNHVRGCESLISPFPPTVPPEWISKPRESVEAVEGEDVFFPCSVSGVPEPLITWRKMAGKK